MQQISDWLEKLGLGQYAQRFAENEIDVTVLRHPRRYPGTYDSSDARVSVSFET